MNQLNFLESKHGKDFATPDGIRAQQELVEKLRTILKTKFDTDV